MNYRTYDPDRDRDAVTRIWREVGWLEPGNEEQAKSVDYHAAAGRSLVAEISGEPECFVNTAPSSLRYLDTDLPASGVTSVTTSHIARHQGLAGRLTATAVALDAADGAAIAALGMFDQGFYDRVGFGTGAPVRWRAFDPAELRVPVTPRPPVRLGLADWKSVHASRLTALRTHGSMVVFPAAFTRGEMHIVEHGFGLGYRDESGTLTHHLWLEPKAMEYGPLHVAWAAYRTYDELLELLGVLKGLGEQYHMVRMHEPPGIQLEDLLARPFRRDRFSKGSTFETGTEADPYWQARICNLSRCLEAVRVVGEPLDLNLSLEDPIADGVPDDVPWRGVGGEYVVRLGDAPGMDTGHDPSLPTLRASVGALTRLWLGVAPASGLAATDRLAGPVELLGRLDVAFRLPRPDYVWDL